MKALLALAFDSIFGHKPSHWAFAPGRVNIMGGHTDYSGGYVLPFTLKQGIYFALALNGLDSIHVHSKDLKEKIYVRIDERAKGPIHWKNCIIGALNELRTSHSIQGFDLVIQGNLPFGAGLSSSSALCCGLIQSICQLLNITIPPLEIAEMAYRIEHDFIGIPCGKMDQLVIAHNVVDHALLLHCKDHSFRAIPLDLRPHCLVLLRSNVIRKLHETDYGLASRECATAFRIAKKKYPELEVLSDLNTTQLRGLEKQFTQSQNQRLIYLLDENARVLRAAAAVEARQTEVLGQLLSECHCGLKELYRVTCPEVDFLAEESIKLPGVLGARMVGGGFGGCVLVLLEGQKAKRALAPLLTDYQSRFGIEAELMTI